MNQNSDNNSQGSKKRPYEKPTIKSGTIKDTFLACGKCTNGPVDQFLCNIFPELS